MPDFKVGHDNTQLEDAIALQAKFFNIRHYQQTLLAKADKLAADGVLPDGDPRNAARKNPYRKNNADAVAASGDLRPDKSKGLLKNSVPEKRLKALSKLQREDLQE